VLWLTKLSRPQEELHALQGTLSPDELLRAERLRSPRDREHFIARRGLLRMALGRFVGENPRGIRFGYGPFGKPALREPRRARSVRFSVSHSCGQALYAICSGRDVGVDIEYVRPLDDGAMEGIVQQLFAESERQAWRCVPSTERCKVFFRAWTRKEAYGKAVGNGIANAFDQFCVPLLPEESARLLDVGTRPEEAGRWNLFDVPADPEYMAALAVESASGKPPACWRWIEESSLPLLSRN
jgi:4'-phosphopantetheinyl transferase